MRNRAKCKLCKSVIESFHSEDYVVCKCDEISVSGGPSLRCAAKNFENFVRVDDEDNEIIVTTIGDVKQFDNETKMGKKELVDMLEALVNNIDALPQHAQTAPATNYDLSIGLRLVLAIFKNENKDHNSKNSTNRKTNKKAK